MDHLVTDIQMPQLTWPFKFQQLKINFISNDKQLQLKLNLIQSAQAAQAAQYAAHAAQSAQSGAAQAAQAAQTAAYQAKSAAQAGNVKL